MPIDPFIVVLPITLAEEGGVSDDPQDPGGFTNLGVTLASWRHWTGQPVTQADMRALTPAAVAPFYRTTFWQAMLCAKLPGGLDLCVFDWGVNSGPAHPARALQTIVAAPVDGHIGTTTIMSVATYMRANGLPKLIGAVQDAREAYYRSLPDFAHFGGGWLGRTARIRAKALAMAGGQ